jgi:hypothetical protein
MRSSRNPEHAEPIAHPRGRSHLQRTAAEDEDLPARRHVDAEDHVGPLEGRPPLRDFEVFQTLLGHQASPPSSVAALDAAASRSRSARLASA